MNKMVKTAISFVLVGCVWWSRLYGFGSKDGLGGWGGRGEDNNEENERSAAAIISLDQIDLEKK